MSKDGLKETSQKSASKEKKSLVNADLKSILNSFEVKKKKQIKEMVESSLTPSEPSRLPRKFTIDQDIHQDNIIQEVKSDHLLIKQIVLTKNMMTGNWEVEKVDTNHGVFGTSEQQTEKIEQQLVRQLVNQLKQAMEQDIKDFIEKEKS